VSEELVLATTGLTKHFGGLAAIVDVDLEVRRNDVVGIIGPNGAGKTTLFNLITGFIAPDRGTVRFLERDVTGLKPFAIVNAGLARTFQLVNAFGELTVRENVLVPCYSDRARRRHAGRPEQEAERILGLVGLLDRRDEVARNLSFGQLRLLDIGRALATDPELLLLDEPFSGLDARDADTLLRALSAMHAGGQSMVIIEHRLRDLMKLARRVVALVFGQKVAEGRPDEIVNDERVIEAYLGHRGRWLGTADRR
jgi:branched-chain amino acid transport system ATP-binding protein